MNFDMRVQKSEIISSEIEFISAQRPSGFTQVVLLLRIYRKGAQSTGLGIVFEVTKGWNCLVRQYELMK